MNEIIFEHEGTGGNCTAFIYRFGDDREKEILLTNGDMSAPTDINEFPIAVSFYIDGYYEDSIDAENINDVLSFCSKVIGREITSIKVVTA